MGTDDTIAWLLANGVTNPFGTLKAGGQISECCKTTTFLSTRENGGKIHNGNNALGINFDMTQVPFNTWVYGIVYNIKGNTVLRDVNNGKNATTLGMWMYVPEDFHQTAGKMAFQLTVYAGFDGSHYVAANSGKAMSAMTQRVTAEIRLHSSITERISMPCRKAIFPKTDGYMLRQTSADGIMSRLLILFRMTTVLLRSCVPISSRMFAGR